MSGAPSLGTADEWRSVGSFALLIVPIGQAGTAVKAASGAHNPRDLDSGPTLPN